METRRNARMAPRQKAWHAAAEDCCLLDSSRLLVKKMVKRSWPASQADRMYTSPIGGRVATATARQQLNSPDATSQAMTIGRAADFPLTWPGRAAAARSTRVSKIIVVEFEVEIAVGMLQT